MAHNRYAIADRGSGEEVMVDAISSLLTQKGHTIIPFMRSSMDIQTMPFGKIRAFFSGIYGRKARKDFSKIVDNEKPDAVFIQNVFPLISPSILSACKEKNIPVVMRCPNYRLICPTGLFMRKGNVCELCKDGRECHCVAHNCAGNMFKSIGYAARNYIARTFCLFINNIDVFMTLTEFARNKLIENGFPPEKVRVISGLANVNQFGSVTIENDGDYIGFAGRVSKEKGIDLFLEAARILPNIPFKVAGNHCGCEAIVQKAPANVEFLGQLDTEDLKRFYKYSRVIVLPSQWYEGLPAVIIEAMLNAKPVICSDLGGLPEVVTNEKTGLLFNPNNVNELADNILKLWNNPVACRAYGNAGRKKALEEFHPDAFYERLINQFKDAIARKGSTRYHAL